MRLPAELTAAIEAEAARFERKRLARAAEELSARYRTEETHAQPALSDDIYRAAYLATRMPATYAAISAVLRELRDRLPTLEITSLLDLGAGPGTALWAAVENFPALKQITALEQDQRFIATGKRLAEHANIPTLRAAEWRQADLRGDWKLAPHELVIISYALNELKERAVQQVIRQAWQHTGKVLVVIETGTPIGYETVIRARTQLIADQAVLLAPCPHARECPMQAGEKTGRPGAHAPLVRDWCHFATRLERSSLHRQLKSGELGYEDEKFSYVIFARPEALQAIGIGPEDQTRAASRIVRHPYHGKGHIKFDLCAQEGLQSETIGKSQKILYRAARKAEWGDAWPPNSPMAESEPD